MAKTEGKNMSAKLTAAIIGALFIILLALFCWLSVRAHNTAVLASPALII
jgi:uncharacterized integral membrane protein